MARQPVTGVCRTSKNFRASSTTVKRIRHSRRAIQSSGCLPATGPRRPWPIRVTRGGCPSNRASSTRASGSFQIQARWTHLEEPTCGLSVVDSSEELRAEDSFAGRSGQRRKGSAAVAATRQISRPPPNRKAPVEFVNIAFVSSVAILRTGPPGDVRIT